MAATSILPDDSLVVRLPDRTVHLDASAGTLCVRASWGARELGGSLVAAHPFSAVRRVRMRPGFAGGVAVEVVLASGRAVDLGDSGTPEGARMTARAVADLCRCQLDAGGGETRVPGPSARFSEAPTFDESSLDFPTGPISVDRRAAQAALGVVPLEASPEPPRPDPIDIRITRELLPAVRRPADEATPVDPPTPADEATPVDPAAQEPVFEALLRESQIAEALSPEGLAASLEPKVAAADDDLDHKPTLIGVPRYGEAPD